MAVYFYIVTVEIDRKPVTFDGTVTHNESDGPRYLYNEITDDLCKELARRDEDNDYPDRSTLNRMWQKVDAVLLYHVERDNS